MKTANKVFSFLTMFVVSFFFFGAVGIVFAKLILDNVSVSARHAQDIENNAMLIVGLLGGLAFTLRETVKEKK